MDFTAGMAMDQVLENRSMLQPSVVAAKMAPQRSWQRRKHARPEEILQAALALFKRRGYRGTKMEDVATEAVITKGTIYLYYTNKTDLFRALVREELSLPLATVMDRILVAEEGAEGDALATLQRLCLEFASVLLAEDKLSLSKVMISETAAFPELASIGQAEIVEPMEAALRDVIAAGMSRGQIREISPSVAASACVAPIFQCVARAVSTPGELDDNRAALSQHLEIIVRGLRPDAPSPI